MRFTAFLEQEYQRVLIEDLLETSLVVFWQQLFPQHFTDEKVLDSLLWAYVVMLKGGGVTDGRVAYQ